MAKLQGMAKRDARSTRIAATIFLFPAVALLIIYMIYPIIDTFLISRLKWNGFYTAEKVFVGWDNWNTLIHDELFWNSFLHNVILMVCSILIQIPLGMALATFLDAGGRKFNIFKILWFLKHEPEMMRRADIIRGTKDYINYRLTGVRATDPSYASGSGVYDLEGWDYSAKLLGATGLDPALLPKIVPSTEPLGPLTREGAELLGLSTGTLVCCGGVDNSCMALGAGSFKKGRIYTSLGSSSWIALCDSHPTLDVAAKSYVFTHVVPGMFTSALSIFSSGTTSMPS